MIESINLKFGRVPESSSETIETTPITVFVGPNNSGKSKVLEEIDHFCKTGEIGKDAVIVGNIRLKAIAQNTVDEKITTITVSPKSSDRVKKDHIYIGKQNKRHHVNIAQLKRALSDPNASVREFCSWYLALNTIKLDGKNRIQLTERQGGGDLRNPQSSLQVLFRDNDKRGEIRRIIYEAFEKYFVIDPTDLGHFSIRLSPTEPLSSEFEKSLTDEAVDFHTKSLPIENASDGVKAFIGILSEVIAGDPLVLLLDEPEAFLHPPLAFKLGQEVARNTMGSEKRIFVATHSPSFVMGCIQSGAPVNIVRLTYRQGGATARILPNEEVTHLMKNPLLRSTGVLSGLFYESAVVTESDADRAFYQEINERLQACDPKRGIANCLFLHAQNKQTVKTIIRPLRALGIPVAGIVDIDVLKEGGQVWQSFLECGYLPKMDREELAGLRTKLNTALQQSGRNMKTDGGIDVLGEEEKESAQNLFEKLAQYGLFIVPTGELESWLKTLRVSGHGPKWLIEVFNKMGEEPNSSAYVVPSEGDVWAFIDNISTWLNNGNRKGMPN